MATMTEPRVGEHGGASPRTTTPGPSGVVLDVGKMVAAAGRDSGGERLTGPDWGTAELVRATPRFV